ncbi:MAG: hypothetical protein GY926_03095 [bacterium]|nr:hypothetical protein [bacterium]
MRHPKQKAMRGAVPIVVFVAVFAVATAVLAATGVLNVNADHSHEGDETVAEPYRIVNEELKGDLWILDKAIAATDSFDVVSVEVAATGMSGATAVVDKTKGSLVVTDLLTTLRLDDLIVELKPGSDSARVIDRSAAPYDRAAARTRAEHEVAEHGNYASRLPEEQPTSWDSLDLALAPSYWVRTMVDRMATEISVIGEESIAGRTADIVQIIFGGDAAQKYGPDGWTWWVDRDTGILLKYAIGSGDKAMEPYVFEITKLEFKGSVPDSIEIPGGVDLTAVEITTDGVAETPIAKTLEAVDARAVAEM